MGHRGSLGGGGGGRGGNAEIWVITQNQIVRFRLRPSHRAVSTLKGVLPSESYRPVVPPVVPPVVCYSSIVEGMTATVISGRPAS